MLTRAKGLIAIGDALLYFGGYPLVTPFQVQSYTTAAAQGWLAALWVSAVVVAPAGEEVLFRGYLTQALGRIARSRVLIAATVGVVFGVLHL